MKHYEPSILDLQATRALLFQTIKQIEARVSRRFKWQLGSMVGMTLISQEFQSSSLANLRLLLCVMSFVLLCSAMVLWMRVSASIPILVNSRIEFDEISIKKALEEQIRRMDDWIVTAIQQERLVNTFGWIGTLLTVLSAVGFLVGI